MDPEADGLKCMKVVCNPQGIAGRCGKAQMIPYWASSCSSRWLKASHGQMTVMSVPKPSIPGISSPNPWTPFFGGLLLNWRVCLCLNLGGPLRGVAGPPLTRVADLISALGGSRFILSCYVWERACRLLVLDTSLKCSRGGEVGCLGEEQPDEWVWAQRWSV